jgi:CRP/FNR family transcriptional regulator, transcriptional activator FtrB
VRPSDLELTRGLPLFADLAPALVDQLTHGAFVQSLPRGAMLCVQGEMPEFLHIVLAGRVALMGQEPGRTETVIEFFETGDVLIAPAVMLEAPYLMSARVVRDSRVLFIQAGQVRRMLKLEPDFTYAMAMQLARYWRKLIYQIKQLKLHSSTERLAAFLVGQSPEERGQAVLELPEDRKVVAARLGMTPESLSRAFAALRKYGVGGRGRRVTIADLGRLREFCRYDDLT